MNLLPITEKENLKKGFNIRFMILLSILISVAFILGVIMLSPAYFLIKGNLVIATSVNSVAEDQDKEMEKQILELPTEIDIKLKFLQTHMASKKTTDSLSKVISNLPKKVSLNTISFKRNQGEKEKKGITVSIFGIAADRESLVAFDTALKTSNTFSTIDIPVSSLTKDKNLPFSANLFISD